VEAHPVFRNAAQRVMTASTRNAMNLRQSSIEASTARL